MLIQRSKLKIRYWPSTVECAVVVFPVPEEPTIIGFEAVLSILLFTSSASISGEGGFKLADINTGECAYNAEMWGWSYMISGDVGAGPRKISGRVSSSGSLNGNTKIQLPHYSVPYSKQ